MRKLLVATLLIFSGILNLNAQTIKTVGATGADYSTLKAAFDAINSRSITGAIELQVTSSITSNTSAALYGAGQVGAVNIVAGGTGYVVGDVVNFSSPGAGTTATGVVSSVSSGAIIGINITNPGSGYTSAPTITVTSTAGAGANITATIGGDYSSVYIYPTTSGITLSGSIGAPIIDLSGADNVTIDGRVNKTGASVDMQIAQTNSYGGSNTVRFINDATNNTLQYLLIKTAYTTGASIEFATSNGTLGNSNNTIKNSKITGTSQNSQAISSFGSASAVNSGNQILDNEIYDLMRSSSFSYISIGANSNNFLIQGNSFYQSTPFTTSANNRSFISFYNSGGHSVHDNYFGGIAKNADGGKISLGASGNTFYSIFVYGTSSGTNSIQGNTFRNMEFTFNSTAYVIYIGAGNANIGTTTGNIIGSQTEVGSIKTLNNGLTAIFSSSTGVVNIENNIISGIATARTDITKGAHLYGIHSGSTGNIKNNIVGSATLANALHATAEATAEAQNVVGIYYTSGSAGIIEGNRVANLKNACKYSATLDNQIYTKGIWVSSGAANVIRNNIVHDLSIGNTGTNNLNSGALSNAPVIGMHINSNSGTSTTLEGNEVYNLSNTRSDYSGIIFGLYLSGPIDTYRNFIHDFDVDAQVSDAMFIGVYAGTTGKLTNNIISLVTDRQVSIHGIYHNTLSTKFYQNTVHIGGTLSDGNLVSSALTSTPASLNITYNTAIKGNILSNTRSNSGTATGKHYAIQFKRKDGDNTDIDYNNYYVSGTGGILGAIEESSSYSDPLIDKETLSDWQTATAQLNTYIVSQPVPMDCNSYSVNPQFANAGGTQAANYLPAAIVLKSDPALSITSDFGNTVTRDATNPAMGAWEYAITPEEGTFGFTAWSATSGSVGSTVVLTGTKFSKVSAVKFNTTDATFTIDSDTQITATVPSGATAGKISVIIPCGTKLQSTENFTVLACQTATITSFTPTSAANGGTVTITGTNFSNVTAVKFNNIAAASYTVVDATTITATVPSGNVIGKVSVTTTCNTAQSTANFSTPVDAATSTLTPTTASIVANGSTTQVLTVTAKDANGNSMISGGATVTITKLSGTGTIGSVTNNNNGTYTATVTSPTTSGTGVFVATLDGNAVKNGTSTQTQVTITYIAGALNAAKSTLTPTTSNIVANGSSTQVLTVTARDANGNALTVGGDTVTITQQSGTGTISAVNDNNDGTYTATVTSDANIGSGVFVATINGSAVKNGTANQTEATVNYILPDTDGDGVPDAVEITDGTDPNDPSEFKDSDSDGVADYVENEDGTNANDATDYKDSDGDGVPDVVETADGTDPNDYSDYKDTDNGGAPDYVETKLLTAIGFTSTNPNLSTDDQHDTDGDGVPDYMEIIDGTDPEDDTDFKDSDGGGVPDYVETVLYSIYGLNPTDPNSSSDDNRDSDNDGISDYQEILDGSDPQVATASTLTIANINNQTVNTTFSVTVTSKDGNGNVTPVTANTTVTLSVATGGITASGTLTGTITAGNSSVTISGIVFRAPATGVSLYANATGLSQATSNTFNVVEAAITNLTYTPSTQTVRLNDPITNMVPSSSGGSVVSYSISPNTLPAGLNFNTSTGIISGTLTAAQSGSQTYSVTATNTLGTSSPTTITLVFNTAPTAISLSKTEIFEGNTIGDVIGLLSTTDSDTGDTHSYSFATGSGDTDNAQFSINANSLKAAAVFNYATKSVYQIRLKTTDSGNLTHQQQFTINVLQTPSISNSEDPTATDPTISKGFSTTLDVNAPNGSTYSWSPSTGLSNANIANPVASPTETTTYTVTITSPGGAVTTLTITVNVVDDYAVKPINVLTPNNDGYNDLWVIENIETYPDNEVLVFDELGRVLFRTTNYQNNWDGTVNGSALAEGAYYYIIKFDGGTKVKKGYISIIR